MQPVDFVVHSLEYSAVMLYFQDRKHTVANFSVLFYRNADLEYVSSSATPFLDANL
jgi:hypothetical protein